MGFSINKLLLIIILNYQKNKFLFLIISVYYIVLI